MSEMIERVALAISGSDALTNVLAIHRSRARLAIEAMREPTDAMRGAGLYRGPLLTDQTENPEGPWRRMIDEALK